MAFTLLEVLLAMMIFGLVTLGIVATFRTASRTYARSDQLMVALQSARAVNDALARDVRATLLVNETNYGALIPDGERDPDRDLPPPELVDPDPTPSAMDDLITEEDFADPWLTAELSFQLLDGGDFDTVELVRRLRSETSRRQLPWGMARMTYRVSDGVLVRSVSPVFDLTFPVIPEADETYEEAQARTLDETPRPEPVDEQLVAGVEMFDVRAIYWADHEWMVVDQWSSFERRVRNPYGAIWPDLINPDLRGDVSLVEDPNFQAIQSATNSLPEDGLPAALEVRLGLRPPALERVWVQRLIIPLFPAQETWRPPDARLLESIEAASRRRRDS